jgi:hypothetical protein
MMFGFLLLFQDLPRCPPFHRQHFSLSLTTLHVVNGLQELDAEE